MEENIKEYLNINAPKYAEFKGYDESFSNSVLDFINGASPTDEVQLYYNEALSAIERFKEGGLIPKYLNGTPSGVSSQTGDNDYLRASWRKQVFENILQALIDALQNGTLTAEEFNEHQKRHSQVYNAAKANNNDYWSKAWNSNIDDTKKILDLYQKLGLNDIGIQPNWGTRYKINSNNPYSKDSQAGGWASDGLFSGITDDRRFGRDGDFTNPEDLEKTQKAFKEAGYDYYLDEGSGYYLLRKLNNPTAQPTTPEGLQSGLDTINQTPPVGNKLLNGLKNVVPDILETAKYIDAHRINKKIRDLFQSRYRYATEEHTPKHLNIYGDLAALNQGYNEAANTESLSDRLATNTSDYRTAMASRLQGNANAEQTRAASRLKYNDLVRQTAEKATQQEFDNIDKEQAVANENYARGVAASNLLLNNEMEYLNRQHANRADYMNYWLTKFATLKQDRNEFMANLLNSQYEEAVALDPKVAAAKKAYEDSNNDTKLYNDYIKVLRETRLRLRPQYYQMLAKYRGFSIDPTNPFIAKNGGKISDDGPVRRRAKDLERMRKARKDWMLSNDKALDRLGRLTYLYAKRAQGKK